jgi:hypothetical protein
VVLICKCKYFRNQNQLIIKLLKSRDTHCKRFSRADRRITNRLYDNKYVFRNSSYTSKRARRAVRKITNEPQRKLTVVFGRLYINVGAPVQQHHRQLTFGSVATPEQIPSSDTRDLTMQPCYPTFCARELNLKCS